MSVLPVSSISLKSNPKLLNFGQNEETGRAKRQPAVSSPMSAAKAVPVVVLMAMSPSMLDSAAAKIKEQQNFNTNRIEMLAEHPTTQIDAEKTYVLAPDELEGIKQNINKPWLRGTSKILESYPYEMNNKKYNMHFVARDNNVINSIYFEPEDYKYIEHISSRKNHPPALVTLVLHNIGKDSFVGAITTEVTCDETGRNGKIIEKETPIPDDIANILIDLVAGDLPYTIHPYMAKRIMKEVYTAELAPTKERADEEEL